jgi:hypothetical protein
LKVPAAVGVPLMVMVLEAHAAFTPAGSPVGVPIPVAPVVVWVMGVSAVLLHSVGEPEAALAARLGVTMMVPAALTVPQPPERGIE